MDLNAECVQRNLAQVLKKYKNEETKTNKRQYPLSSVLVQDQRRYIDLTPYTTGSSLGDFFPRVAKQQNL